MNLLRDALRAGHAPPVPRRPAARRVLVIGGAGVLGSAVLEQLLACRAFAQVAVLVTQPLNTSALPGLVPVARSALALPASAHAVEDTAVIVFDRERHANGREDAFARPEPAELPELARALRQRGVRRLIVVVPHAPGSLPDALKQGLANLDEQAVAALGFEQLLFMRSAQAPAGPRSGQALQRLADWVLSQLRVMISQRDQPVRASKVAQFAAQLAALLPTAPRGTRVVPPELVWEAAQTRQLADLASDWLNGRTHAELPVPTLRM
ncbi:hypothetical protein [Piscinibacter sp.]|jgi:nucleoside-diphosphate-sugar epimerase|uniref:hypothetical protein n=1 Tax=Piscinibacter sp. TaxID=1903157 RepID=UPI003559873C